MAVPPEYPALTAVTPFMCSKTAWIPQKHPPASTAVSLPLALAKGESTAGLGMATAALEALEDTMHPQQSRAKTTVIVRSMIIAPQDDFANFSETELMQ